MSPFVAPLGLLLLAAALGREPADLLLLNGRVYTLAWDEPAADGRPAANAPHSAAGFRPDAEALAIQGYTTWNAYAASWEEETGVLLPGRWADVTVMDVDPFVLGATDPGKLLGGKIVATIVGGKLTYEAGNRR